MGMKEKVKIALGSNVNNAAAQTKAPIRIGKWIFEVSQLVEMAARMYSNLSS